MLDRCMGARLPGSSVLPLPNRNFFARVFDLSPVCAPIKSHLVAHCPFELFVFLDFNFFSIGIQLLEPVVLHEAYHRLQ